MPGYRRVPDFVQTLIDHLDGNTFYVGRTRTYTSEELAGGALAHLGVAWNETAAPSELHVVPGATNGRWSRYNINGRDVIRRDLPKIEKWIGGWTTPNFGDYSKGSHTHNSVRQVFQRETHYGQNLSILIDFKSQTDGQIVVGFRVDRVFDRTQLNGRDLLLACSLLRENIKAHVHVVSTGLSVADWLLDQQVSWEILPHGEASFEKVLERLQAAPGSLRVRTMQDRYKIVDGMHPSAIVVGSGGFSRYFGFQFKESLVALENLDYGNALYLMYENWQELSRRSRVDLLADTTAQYDRVVHRDGWEDRLRTLLLWKGHDATDQ